jgi:hypothetical protein
MEAIPKKLLEYDQWVCWRMQERKGKITKIPYNPISERPAKTNDPETWTDFKLAAEACEEYGFDGIGFVLTDLDPFTGFDIDNCINPKTGIVEEEAKKLIDQLNSYTEISPSGRGIRIFVEATIPKNLKRNGIEVYNDKRYLTVTGNKIDGCPNIIGQRQAETDAIYSEYSNKNRSPDRLENFGRTFNDRDLLEEAFQWKDGEKIKRLSEGDWSDYPSQSEADLSLCSYLAKIFDNDCERIDKLFRESGLHRKKWDEVHSNEGLTYGEMTIKNATQNLAQEDKKEPNSKIEIYSFADIRKLPRDRSDPVINGILYPKQSLMITGPTGIGKSTVELDLALALGCGGSFLNTYEISQSHKVLLLQSENDFRTFQDRLFSMTHDWTGNREEALKSIFTPYVNGTPQIAGAICDRNGMPAEFVKTLEWLIEQTEADIVMFDPLISFHAGDENDNTIMRKTLDTITGLSNKHSFTTVVCHHHGKTRQNGVYNARGASAISDWSSVVLTLSWKKGKEEGHFISAEWDKVRSFKPPKSLILELCEGSSFEIVDTEKIQATPREIGEIVEKEGGQWLGWDSLVKTVQDSFKIGRKKAEDAVSKAVESGYIIQDKNPENQRQRIYTLPDDWDIKRLTN